MCDECEDLRERVEELEATLEQLVEYRGGDGFESLWIDGHPVGRVTSQAHQTAEEAKKLAQQDGDSPSVDPDTRAAMLPAHRMWADIKLDAKELDKRERRVATLFGAFIQRATGKDSSAHDALEFQYVGVSGTQFTLSSTDAKDLLATAEPVEKDRFYSAEIARVFEALQGFTKCEKCDCDHIETCGHGLVTFDASRGTNRVAVNKARFRDYLESVQATATADDDVIPESGASEDPAAIETAEADAEADQQLQQLEAATPSNTVVSTGEASGVRSDGGGSRDS